MSNSYNSGTATQVQRLLDMVAQAMDLDIDLTHSASFRLKLESMDGQSVACELEPLDQGKPMRRVVQMPEGITVPAGGAADFDGASGTATLVSSTVTVTVPTPAEGGAAVPVGSTVYATVTSAGGKAKLLSAARASDSTITISSTGSGYGALLESAGVAGTLVAGTVDITLANAVGDRLAVFLSSSAGTPGALQIVRKSATEVTVNSYQATTTAAGVLVSGEADITLAVAVGDRLSVVAGAANGGTPGVLSAKRTGATTVHVESWLSGSGIQTADISDVTVYNHGPEANGDISDVIAYNFGQAAHETSTVRWVVIRP